MAVVNSLAIGKAVKSAGNLTYKVSRGRTIASQRITSNPSKTHAQQAQRGTFGRAAIAMQLISRYIDSMFEKSKYGSSRNNFVKKNGLINFGGVVPEIQEGVIPLKDGFVTSFACDENGVPVKYAGRYTSFGSGAFIVTEDTGTHQYQDSDRNNHFIRECMSLTVNPTAGVDISKIEVRVAGFAHSETNPNPPLFVRSITPDTKGITDLLALGIDCEVTTDEASGTVSSIVLNRDISPNVLIQGSIYAITVAVGGRIATTTGLWFIEDLNPLP